ncbi:ABC transporter ATP-binding protein [Candidatus Bathyarchaeota archaeon]|nr:ABC transporter ATP-binding protein [Candidatus Bathyarchaeota archaeon]
MPYLEVSDLHLYYETVRGIVRAVDGVEFMLEKGEALGLVGESGCGKSSTANALLRLLPKNYIEYRGHIILGRHDLMNLSDDEFREQIRWKRISMIFQGAMNSLNPVLRVGFQVAEPLMIHRNLNKEEALRKASELFKLVGLPSELVDRYPHELSGGMKQRVVISMALVLNPELIILDEPTSALDVSIQAQIMNLLKTLKNELGITMVFITHDIALASDLSDKVAVMYAGQIVELGFIEDVLHKPLHPYSQKLVASVPLLKGNKKPEFIPGAPPDLVAPPHGCRFAPRCPFIKEKCMVDPPSSHLVGGGYVKCWLYE